MSKKKHTSIRYADDVLTGKIVSCHTVILACKRFKSDLKNAKKLQIEFNEQRADHALAFFKFLKHSKGEHAGKRFHLEQWQEFIVSNAFGWLRLDGARRFNYAYVEVPRKNGKTTFAAGVANYLFIGDGESGAEVYTAATKKEQAKICFDEARSMVLKSPDLKKYVTVQNHNMHMQHNASKFEPLSNESNTLDGLNPHGSIVDEYHAHRDASLYNVLKSGMGSRQNPLHFTITTAGFNKHSPCYQLRGVAIKVLEGSLTQENMFSMIFTPDEGDDWRDSTTWKKSNPNLGVSCKEEYLKNECQSAINNPLEEVNFKTKNLNIWTNASSTWINDEDYMLCDHGGDPAALLGRECWGGLDLASTQDLNAYTLIFPNDDNETYDALYWFWAPEAKAEKQTDGVDYKKWALDELVTLTEGNVCDHRVIIKDILHLHTLYNVQSTAFDRHLASHSGVIQALDEEDVSLSPFGQGFVSMSEPTKEIGRIILSGRLNHFGNPIMRWMTSNVEIRKDPAGNEKIDKAKSASKVDGPVSQVMALGQYMTDRANNSGEIGCYVV